MRQFQFQTTSDPEHLAPARKAIEAFCKSCGFDEAAIGEIGLVVNEAMANVTRHAYGGAVDRPVRIEAEFENDQLVIKLRDWGNGKTPAPAPKHDPLTPGGLGLVCMQSLMTDMKYEPQPDGMLLIMRRHKSKAAHASS